TWSVPPTWFVPFAPAERSLVLRTTSNSHSSRPATPSATRTLIYVIIIVQAPHPPGASPDHGALHTAALVRASVALEEIGRWLEEFHPHSLVELDYGGLVQLLDDDALRADQSVAEVSATVSALASREFE